jgi:DNA-binding beta-propeller fold protein YncE
MRLAAAALSVVALSAAALLAPVTGAAAATPPVTGNEAIVAVGAVGPKPIVSPDGTRLYVADNGSSGASVLAFDTTTGAALPAETTDVDEDEITGLALGPDGHTFHVAGTNNAATAGLQIIQH